MLVHCFAYDEQMYKDMIETSNENTSCISKLSRNEFRKEYLCSVRFFFVSFDSSTSHF